MEDDELPADVTEEDIQEAKESGWTTKHNVAVLLDYDWVIQTQQSMGDDDYRDMWDADVYGETREDVEGKGGTNTRILKMEDAETVEVDA